MNTNKNNSIKNISTEKFIKACKFLNKKNKDCHRIILFSNNDCLQPSIIAVDMDCMFYSGINNKDLLNAEDVIVFGHEQIQTILKVLEYGREGDFSITEESSYLAIRRNKVVSYSKKYEYSSNMVMSSANKLIQNIDSDVNIFISPDMIKHIEDIIKISKEQKEEIPCIRISLDIFGQTVISHESNYSSFYNDNDCKKVFNEERNKEFMFKFCINAKLLLKKSLWKKTGIVLTYKQNGFNEKRCLPFLANISMTDSVIFFPCVSEW